MLLSCLDIVIIDARTARTRIHCHRYEHVRGNGRGPSCYAGRHVSGNRVHHTTPYSHKLIVSLYSSQIWTEDRHTLTCQDDPYCIEFSSFKPTNEKYPGTTVDEVTHTPDFWDDIHADLDGPPPQRWAWMHHELSAIPENERGTIPAWKLFTTTYVSDSACSGRRGRAWAVVRDEGY
jgi:hypothetical protein